MARGVDHHALPHQPCAKDEVSALRHPGQRVVDVRVGRLHHDRFETVLLGGALHAACDELVEAALVPRRLKRDARCARRGPSLMRIG